MPRAVVSCVVCATRGMSCAACWASIAGRLAKPAGDKGWKCSNCEALVLEREYLERVYDPDATDGRVMSHGGAAAGALPPFG
jgi:hypothetical protein